MLTPPGLQANPHCEDYTGQDGAAPEEDGGSDQALEQVSESESESEEHTQEPEELVMEEVFENPAAAAYALIRQQQVRTTSS